MEENTVLCGANSYEQKYYFNQDFDSLPESVKRELQVMCVLYTEDVGGILTLDPEQVEDCVVYASITAGAEEIAVLRMTDEDAAKAALEALKGRVEDQIAALKDYQPEEVGKLDGAILDRQGTTVLLAVPASHDLAQAALDALR